MKVCLALFAIFFLGSCFGQTPEESEGLDQDKLSVGISSNFVFDFAEYPVLFVFQTNSFSSEYISKISDNSYLSFHQVHAEYRMKDKFYIAASLGAGIDNIDCRVEYFSQLNNSDVGGSYSYTTERTIFIEETRTSVVGSFETGSYFLKPERTFRFGLGVGLDFIGYAKPKVSKNELVKEVYNVTSSNATGTTVYSSTTVHDNQSAEWNKYVRDNSREIISPKITGTLAFRINEHLSFFGKAQVRFSIGTDYLIGIQGPIEIPVGIGLQYHF